MQDAINAQINAEMWSAYLYLAMSLDANDKGFFGVANWFKKQYEEEMEHAFRFVKYLQDQMARVELSPITEFTTKWASPLAMYENALAHEKKVTALINDLYKLSLKENDYATTIMLQWFVTEQVEEENDAQTIVDMFKMAGNDKTALFMIDRKLGKRE
ncbi:MAG: ferritin [Bacteroidales bacterium]|nr:ferritin [Bacteroidales bacterium]